MFLWFQVVMRHCRISEMVSASRHRLSGAKPAKHALRQPLLTMRWLCACSNYALI